MVRPYQSCLLQFLQQVLSLPGQHLKATSLVGLDSGNFEDRLGKVRDSGIRRNGQNFKPFNILFGDMRLAKVSAYFVFVLDGFPLFSGPARALFADMVAMAFP
jgi:hypothetical protein